MSRSQQASVPLCHGLPPAAQAAAANLQRAHWGAHTPSRASAIKLRRDDIVRAMPLLRSFGLIKFRAYGAGLLTGVS